METPSRITIDSCLNSSARGAKPLEVIGTYNPIPKRPTNLYNENANARPYKEVALDRSRAQYWLGVGAQPSDPVWKLLGMVSQIPLFQSGDGCSRMMSIHGYCYCRFHHSQIIPFHPMTLSFLGVGRVLTMNVFLGWPRGS
jgi:ribosomal protein S16